MLCFFLCADIGTGALQKQRWLFEGHEAEQCHQTPWEAYLLHRTHLQLGELNSGLNSITVNPINFSPGAQVFWTLWRDRCAQKAFLLPLGYHVVPMWSPCGWRSCCVRCNPTHSFSHWTPFTIEKTTDRKLMVILMGVFGRPVHENKVHLSV